MISKCFRDWRTAEGLTYERWHYFHSQFEEILGYKVEVWRSVLEKWEKERQKREAAAKAKEMAACTILFGGGKMMSGGGARGDRAHLQRHRSATPRTMDARAIPLRTRFVSWKKRAPSRKVSTTEKRRISEAAEIGAPG